MTTLPGAEIQRLVLEDAPRGPVRHLIMSFPEQAGGRQFLRALLKRVPVTPADPPAPAGAVHTSLGFTYRGLERLKVPPFVLGQFQAGAAAFTAGAARRAAEQLGDTGASAAAGWDAGFGLERAHALLTLHADDAAALALAEADIAALADAARVGLCTLAGAHLGAPPGERGQWVHFGYRDGLSRLLVRGWHTLPAGSEISQHAAGEFLLGHANDHDFNPWLLPTAHADVRSFFRNGSFGVLRQVEQDVDAFERWVHARAAWLQRKLPDTSAPISWPAYVKAKVCGRWPDGRRVRAGAPHPTAPEKDFDYRDDPDGRGCPLGAHVRRMNPRLDTAALQATRNTGVALARQRPLIRRGRPYGPMRDPHKPLDAAPDAIPRGLLGLFFCASLEDQFEHVVGQWAERPPLGVADRGNAKDPLAGQHEDPAARFDIPLADGRSVDLVGLHAFVRTRGTLYAFHPSLPALRLLLDNADFYDLPEAPLAP